MSRSGNKAFDRCDVRVVEFGHFLYLEDRDGDFDYENDIPEDDRNKRFHAGYHATLHCPRTEDDRISVTSEYESEMDKSYALKSLKKLAGELVCHDCRYSSMTPAEVSQDRAKFLRAETERVEALTALEQARDELRLVTPQLLPPKPEQS